MSKNIKILLLENDPGFLDTIKKNLSKSGYDVIAPENVNNLSVIEETIFNTSPDLILCDISLKPSGFEILESIKNSPQLRLIPFFFLADSESFPEKVEAYLKGVDNYILKSINNDELLAMITSALKRQKDLNAAIYLDPLTQIYNRRFFQKELDRQLKLHMRHGDKFTLAMMDLDHFKKINDTYGHPCGDECLIAFSRFVQSQIRSTDIFARWGGEEFVLIMERSELEGAYKSVKNILNNLKPRVLVTCDGQGIKLSFSAGVSQCPTNGTTAKELIDAADKSVYHAKQLGRSRIEIAKS